jgi:hypothetical protein
MGSNFCGFFYDPNNYTPYNLQWRHYGKFFFKSQVFFKRANCLIKNVTERLIKKGSLTHNGCYRITDP